MYIPGDLSPKLSAAFGIITSDKNFREQSPKKKICKAESIAGEKISKLLGSLPCEQIFYWNIPLGAPGVLLNKMKIITCNSSLCIHFDLLELLFHALVNCIVIQKFWFEVISWWKSHIGEWLQIDKMCGYNPKDPKMHFFH